MSRADKASPNEVTCHNMRGIADESHVCKSDVTGPDLL
jgi:hypothetical protein